MYAALIESRKNGEGFSLSEQIHANILRGGTQFNWLGA
jgi:hypothetical protein